MPFIIYPVQALAGIDSTPATDRSFVADLTAIRARQMAVFWRRVATTLGLDADRELDGGLAAVLPAGGAIIIDGDKNREDRLGPMLRGHSSWLQAFPLLSHPGQLPQMATLQAPAGASLSSK